MWSKGSIDGYEYWVKHFEEGSEYGINGGRISKLELRKDGKALVGYDRGWDTEPKGCEVMAAYKRLLKQYN